jgi:hypothetical protein
MRTINFIALAVALAVNAPAELEARDHGTERHALITLPA